MPSRMPDTMSEYIQIECQIECQNLCQIECREMCQIECQNICQTWEGGTKARVHVVNSRRGRVKCRSDRFRRPAESPTAEASILPTLLLGTMRNTQPPFHASFLAFPNPSHPTLGSHEKHPNPFSCFIFSVPKPFPPTLGNHEARNPFFMRHFWPSQTIPTTLLGTILNLPKPFPPHPWESWETLTAVFMLHF